MPPYERIVQWAAGPISILAGYLATQITTHLDWLGQLGLGKSSVAHAIFELGTFAVSAGLTYAAHHKWLSNLALWWQHASEIAGQTGVGEIELPNDATEGSDQPPAELDTSEGTPADQIVAAGAPEATS